MDAAPPLDELEARKRLVQAKMDLHRAEMAIYCHQVTDPIFSVRNRFARLASNPVVRYSLVGGLGFLLVSGRMRLVRRLAGWGVPLLLPRVRSMAGVVCAKAGFFLVKRLFRR